MLANDTLNRIAAETAAAIAHEQRPIVLAGADLEPDTKRAHAIPF